ncbi:MAG: TRAP transporter large permease [Deltaproteobacteria bacterium]|nr:TRAP transporter large permease [Deltaproteobacteria bacterium]MBW2305774.1 TRAP transporter large permease [Deltaproteobacteria bacterium]
MAWLFIFLAIFLVMGIPIAFSLCLSVTLTFALFSDLPLEIITQRLAANLSHFTLMAIPFFILAGVIMERGGIARRLVNLANSLVGWVHGGLALTTVLSCMFFAAISGSSAATVAAIGSIMIPAMWNSGYDKKYAVGVTATAGCLGILIPPSVTFIAYGFVTEQSIGRLFIAGIIPGIILGFSLMLVSYLVARRKNMKSGEKTTWAQKWIAFKEAFLSLLLPIIIIGGIYGVPGFKIGSFAFKGGAIFTPTEAAAVAVVYALVVSIFVHREMKFRDIPAVLYRASGTIAMLLMIITNAILFGFILTSEEIPLMLAEWIVTHDFSPWLFLLVINIVLFFAGDFLDAFAIVMIFIPVLYPAAMELGIDPIHLGVVVVVNMEMGLITPPIGIDLYVASGISGMPLYDVMRAAAPWILVVVAVLILITYVPSISLFLPNLLYGPG